MNVDWSSYRSRMVRVTAALLAVSSLSGCLAAAGGVAGASGLIAAGGMAGMVNGMIAGSDNFVSVDPASVDPGISQTLARAKRITMVKYSEADVHTATYLELEGGYEVDFESLDSLATPSQLRRLSQRLCDARDRPDVVMSSYQDEANIGGTKSMIKGYLTGKVSSKITGTAIMFRCRDRWQSSFPLTMHMNQSLWNGDQFQIEQDLGKSWGSVLIQLAQGSNTSTSNPTTRIDVRSAQTSLQQAGYDPGVADGVMGGKTAAAIREFQADQGLPVTGTLDKKTVEQLQKQ